MDYVVFEAPTKFIHEINELYYVLWYAWRVAYTEIFIWILFYL